MTTVDAKAQALAEALQQFTGRPLRDGDSLGAGTHSVGPTVGEVRMLLADLPEEWNSAPFRICHTAQYAEDISSDGLAQEISACWSGKIEGGKPVMERCIRVTGE
jgi:hypothetical protein